MKRIMIVTIIAGLTGCQGSPSLTADELCELSNEDLCRALGTYNHKGGLVLKIYNELEKRPEKIDSERCYALEHSDKKQKSFPLKVVLSNQPARIKYETFMYKGQKIRIPVSASSQFYRGNSTHIPGQHEIVFEQIKNKSIIKEEEDMKKTMRKCLIKHRSHFHSHIDTDTDVNSNKW